jgi:tRNA-uridine 2-sulfurtransferase
LTQEQLSRTRFPLGGMTKPEVRDRARSYGLALAEKPDSQEICFVPGGEYKDFLAAYLAEQGQTLPDTRGELITRDGRVVGEHHGIHNFTIGQRKGLGFAAGKPLYVLAIEPHNNRVIVGDDNSLRTTTFEVENVNWISIAAPSEPIRATVKIRHKHEPAAATVECLPDSRARITFDSPQRAVTPGQAAVIYSNDLVLAGSWIR